MSYITPIYASCMLLHLLLLILYHKRNSILISRHTLCLYLCLPQDDREYLTRSNRGSLCVGCGDQFNLFPG